MMRVHGLKAVLSRWVVAANNPTTFVDATGLEPRITIHVSNTPSYLKLGALRSEIRRQLGNGIAFDFDLNPVSSKLGWKGDAYTGNLDFLSSKESFLGHTKNSTTRISGAKHRDQLKKHGEKVDGMRFARGVYGECDQDDFEKQALNFWVANTVIHEILGHQIGDYQHTSGWGSIFGNADLSSSDDTPVFGRGWLQKSATPYTNYGQVPGPFMEDLRQDIMDRAP